MSLEELTAIGRLQALVELTRLVGEEGRGDAFLDDIAQLLADTVGFAGIVINVYRPAWDDFQAVSVVGSREMRDELLGGTYGVRGVRARRALRAPRRVLHPRGRGRLGRPPAARATSLGATSATTRTPGIQADELFVPCRDSEGRDPRDHLARRAGLGPPADRPRARLHRRRRQARRAGARARAQRGDHAPAPRGARAAARRLDPGSPSRPRPSPSCSRSAKASSAAWSSRRC